MKMSFVYALTLATLTLSSAQADTCWKLKGETPAYDKVPKRVCATSAKFTDRTPFKPGMDREMQLTFGIIQYIDGATKTSVYDNDLHTRNGGRRGILLAQDSHDEGPEYLSYEWLLIAGVTTPKDKEPSGTLRELDSVRLEYDYREGISSKPGFSYDNQHLTLDYERE